MVEGGILARPPLNILIDPNAANRKSPWEIHISELLDMFLEAIMKSEFLDLRAAGTAALTSATIYRFKVESLFLFEKLQRERRFMGSIEPPQIVVMPFRYEVYSTTVDELFALGMTPAQAAGKKFYHGAGCNNCRSTGFKGRIGVFELLMNTQRMR